METFKGEVIYYNQHGEGVVFYNEKPVYIYGTIIGEEIEYEITKTMKNYFVGKLIKIIKVSKNRIYHDIKNAHLIGGYDLIHMNDEEQKKFKINKVYGDFKNIAKVELKKIDWFSPDKKIKYRNKLTLHDGCFYQKNTNEKIEIEDFLLSEIKWNRNLKGDIIYRQLDTLIFGTKNDKLFTSDTMLNYKFRVGLNSFYQINKESATFAYQYILDNIIENENTLDLFSGIGTISIIVSSKSKKVVGVEINKSSHLDGIENLKINNVDNVELINDDVDKFILKNNDHFENVILDPSREGVNKKTLELINNVIKPKRIIYMSCNPSTQASNFNHLKDNYEISKFIVIDMFCQTYHIESIMVLNRK